MLLKELALRLPLIPSPAVTLTHSWLTTDNVSTGNKLIWQLAFHPVSCMYTLNILGPVSHFGINNRLESKNRLHIGFFLLSAGKKRPTTKTSNGILCILSSPFPKYCSSISSIHFYSLISISSHYTTSVQFLSGHSCTCLAVLGTLYLPLEPTQVSRWVYCWALKSLFISPSAPAAFLHSANSAFCVAKFS